jgi:hypothetical protein
MVPLRCSLAIIAPLDRPQDSGFDLVGARIGGSVRSTKVGPVEVGGI